MKLNRLTLAVASGLWLGSAESHAAALDTIEAFTQLEAQGPAVLQAKIAELRGGRSTTVDMMEVPPMYEIKDGVAVFKISGPLITGTAGWMRIFGVIGYDDIKMAARELMSQKNVKSVLLHVNSPGGSASGCEDCVAALAMLGTVKPLFTFTDTYMASGGYWLGSVGRQIFTTKTAMLGSIGVIVTHVEYSKANEKEGRTVTLVRAGEHKQLANPNEPLSDEAKSELKAKAEQMYDIFADSISTQLGVGREKFDAKMGRGREFMGVKAVEAGLAHQVASFDEAFAVAKAVDTSKLSSQNSRTSKGTSNMKATLATKILMQLAAGTPVSQLQLNAAEATMEGTAPDAEALMLLQAQAITVEAAMKEGREKAVSEATKPLTDKVTELQASLSTANTELGALRTGSTALTAQVQALESAVTASEKVLRGTIATMCLQLQVGDKSADLKGAELVAEHARVEGEFLKKFPGARVSSAAGATQTQVAATPGGVPMFARLAAAQQPSA
jgi:signal peptide peptidase SppA